MDGNFENINIVVKKGMDLSTASVEVHRSGLCGFKVTIILPCLTVLSHMYQPSSFVLKTSTFAKI